MVFAKKLLLQNKQNEDKTLGQMLEEAEGSQELWILAEGAQTGECCLPGILPSSAECPPPAWDLGSTPGQEGLCWDAIHTPYGAFLHVQTSIADC